MEVKLVRPREKIRAECASSGPLCGMMLWLPAQPAAKTRLTRSVLARCRNVSPKHQTVAPQTCRGDAFLPVVSVGLQREFGSERPRGF